MSEQKIQGLNCILLVDDDLPTNFLHNKVIEMANINTPVQIVTDGLEALEYLTSTGQFSGNTSYPQPGIIFLDINMPRMDGWEFLEAYKNLDDAKKARIIVAMLTTSVNPADKERAEENGEITTYLNKPLTVDDVKKLVQTYFSL